METMELDGIQVWPQENRLLVDGQSVRVEPKVMDVLVLLMAHPGEVVTRRTLLDTVWAGRVVGEEVLTRCISELRAALGDRASRPHFIQTVPKRGYLLLQTPRELPQQPRDERFRSSGRWMVSAATAAAIAMAVSLVVWSVGRSEAGLPATHPAPAQPAATSATASAVTARDLSLLGHHYWQDRTPESLKHAIGYFQQAIQAKPGDAEAYAGLANVYMLQASYDRLDGDTAVTLAEPLIGKALTLNPDSSHAYASRGMLLQFERDFPAAEKALARATELDPGNTMAHMWRGNAVLAMGRLGEALAHYETAFALDPGQMPVAYNYIDALMEAGRIEEAGKLLQSRQISGPSMIHRAAKFTLYSGDWHQVQALADALRDDSVGSELLRWRLAVTRQDMAVAAAELTAAPLRAPGCGPRLRSVPPEAAGKSGGGSGRTGPASSA